MKRNIVIMLLLALLLAGCNSKQGSDPISEIMSDSLKSPEKQYLTQQQLQEQVDYEIRSALELANDERVADAIQIIGLSEQAVKHILDSNYTAAISNLEIAIGKAAVMTAARPDLSLFPLDVNVTVRDMVADADVLYGIRKEADELTDKGYLQAARHLLKDMASEIEITTPMLPIATYPDALSMAARALSEEKNDEALMILNTALSTVFVESKYIPLPIIRAERMLAEVSALLEEEDRDTFTDINTLLNNAEYQIRFAEALGYGRRDREFEEMYTAIKEIRKELKKEDKGESVKLTNKLRDKLNLFKERISREKADNRKDQ